MGDLENSYLIWLENQVHVNNGRSYHELFKQLQSKEFIWLIPNDDNRIADGFDVRHEYFRRYKHHAILSHGCSVLEVIIALSRRLAFATGGAAENWAWTLIEHLGLHKMSGHIGRIRENQIEEILENLIWRNYHPDGTGGFFPLAWPNKDQREVEIWYQMCAYIDENPEL